MFFLYSKSNQLNYRCNSDESQVHSRYQASGGNSGMPPGREATRAP